MASRSLSQPSRRSSIAAATASTARAAEGDGRHDRVRRAATATAGAGTARRDDRNASGGVSGTVSFEPGRPGQSPPRAMPVAWPAVKARGLTVAGEDRSSKFLAAAASLGDRSAKAHRIERIDALVPEGTLIPGILETAIVSDLPGQVRAIVSQDVYSFDGRRVLIPTGTRLIGEYQSEITRGQKRIFVVWTRMLRDDGVSVRLNSIGADSLGRAGLTGRVDKKFRERFGAAILLSIVGAGASYLTGYGSEAVSGDSDDAAGRGRTRPRDNRRDILRHGQPGAWRFPADSADDQRQPGRAHLRLRPPGPRFLRHVRGSRHRSAEGDPS